MVHFLFRREQRVQPFRSISTSNPPTSVLYFSKLLNKLTYIYVSIYMKVRVKQMKHVNWYYTMNLFNNNTKSLRCRKFHPIQCIFSICEICIICGLFSIYFQTSFISYSFATTVFLSSKSKKQFIFRENTLAYNNLILFYTSSKKILILNIWKVFHSSNFAFYSDEISASTIRHIIIRSGIRFSWCQQPELRGIGLG